MSGGTGADHRVPVTVLTGFLGSGKTTLLKRLLASPGARDVAVLVNEVAEAGIDQRVLGAVADRVQVLENGCICCTVQEDFRRSLAELLARGTRLARVVIETTGLADPAPILAVFASDPMLRFHFRIGAIVTTVDCINAPRQQGESGEFANQVAAADRVVLTKTDLAEGAAVAAAQTLVARLNPSAVLCAADLSDAQLAGEVLAEMAPTMSEAERFKRLIDANLPARRIFGGHSAWDEAAAVPFVIAAERPFDWSAFAVWLAMLLHAHGDKVLRLKGIVEVAGSGTPVLINGVHRLMHQPEHLPRWPDGERRSLVVFIVRGLDPEVIRDSFEVLVG